MHSTQLRSFASVLKIINDNFLCYDCLNCGHSVVRRYGQIGFHYTMTMEKMEYFVLSKEKAEYFVLSLNNSQTYRK